MSAKLYQEALTHFKQQRFSEAANLFQHLITCSPYDAELLRHYAISCFKLGRHDIAFQSLHQATEVDPDQSADYRTLATWHSQLGHLEKARFYIEQALIAEGLAPPSENGIDIALLVETLCLSKLSNWGPHADDIVSYGRLRQHTFKNNDELALCLAHTYIKDFISLCPATELFFRGYHVLSLLGFFRDSYPSWSNILFEQVALPWLLHAIEHELYDFSLNMEGYIYQEYVKQTETEEHFSKCFQQWIAPMRHAGKRVNLKLAPLLKPPTHQKPVLGFFVHQANTLAHVEVLVSMLEAYLTQPSQPYIPKIYFLRGTDPALTTRLKNIGASFIYAEVEYSLEKGSVFNTLLCLRERASQDQVSAMIWVSLPPFMAFAFSMRMAPVQIWWALKYHGLELPEIDGYVTSGTLAKYKTINGKVWRTAPLGRVDWFDPCVSKQASEVRATYEQFECLLGSLGREEKLNSAEFLRAVATLLQRYPKSAFLWPGKIRHRNIQEYFEQVGVADRCFFIGWVDTRLYAQVIDVFLDSFPFPCGFTAYEAMAAGKPIVVFASPEAYETGLYGFIATSLESRETNPELYDELTTLFRDQNGESLFLCARSTDEYISHASRLLSDPSLRVATGNINRTFIERYLQDARATSLKLADHFIEIIEEHRNTE